jgi:uncharacterized cofD-like protein
MISANHNFQLLPDKRTPRVVCIGGGTGTFVVLKGLKQFPINLGVIVAMSDSGGSNKRIRDEFGLLPTSDIRQCLVALSDEEKGPELLRRLFMYRYDRGRGIKGMTFGNLFMAALADILGSQEQAIKQTSKVLRIKGNVIPVSYTKTDLYAKYENGLTVSGEHFIDEPKHDGRVRIAEVFLKPQAVANPDAIEAILKADMLVLGPGDLFTSLIPNFLVVGISQAISRSKAKVVYICNLMTKYGQTYNYSASDHVTEVQKFIKRRLTHVIVNSSQINHHALSIYAKFKEKPVRNDLSDKESFRVINRAVAGKQLITRNQSDKLVRSLIRHDSQILAMTLMQILENRV